MNGRIETYPKASIHAFIGLRRTKQRQRGQRVFVDAFGRRVVFV